MKEYIKISDLIRWMLTIIIIFFIYIETGICTSFVIFILISINEFKCIAPRIKKEIYSEISSLVKK